MAEVTVIAPNVVEFVGNLAGQTALNAERAAPPAPQPPKAQQPLKPRNDAGSQSQRLSANQNSPAAPPAAPRTTSPGGFNLTGDLRRRPGRPSTQFLAQQIAQVLAQQIAQESAKFARSSASFATAASAYEKTRSSGGRTANEPVTITRRINKSV